MKTNQTQCVARKSCTKMVCAAAEAVAANVSQAAVVVKTCARLPTSMHTHVLTEDTAAHAAAVRAVRMPQKNQLTVSASHTAGEHGVLRPGSPHNGSNAPGVGWYVASRFHWNSL